ncbi:MAG: thiol peroxidase [Flavobacterium sp.]|nr:MAG: thiol peroxidase [Flavobacterium sp.]
MSDITLHGQAIKTVGELPSVGSVAPNFELVKDDLSMARLADYHGSNVVLNIFPSIDTSTCATSVRKFNELASGLENTKVLCISRDLPFAQKRFCGAEGLNNVETLSDFREGNFGKDYGVAMVDGKLAFLHARAIVVLDKDAKVIYTELVPDIGNEPNYEKALAALK